MSVKTDKKIEIIDNEKQIIEKIQINEHEIKDEYHNNKILKIMKDKNIFVKVLYPVSVKLRIEKPMKKSYLFHHIINCVNNLEKMGILPWITYY